LHIAGGGEQHQACGKQGLRLPARLLGVNAVALLKVQQNRGGACRPSNAE
jgi:hypothetical protein